MDQHTNLAYAAVVTAPAPPDSGTGLTLTAGLGALFPTPPFNGTVWPTGVQPLKTNAEIVRVTAMAGDVITAMTRAQEGTTARTILVGDQFAATITVKAFTDIEAAIPTIDATVLPWLATPTSANLAAAMTNETGSGRVVFNDTPLLLTPVLGTPTLLSPILGTPSSGDLVNCTGYATSALDGLGANVATFLATPSSANLAAALTNETGTGLLVFNDTPTLIAPLLGTPTSGVLTNCTGLPLASVTGLAANMATFLATPSSANLAATVTNETGSGLLVFATSPTLTTPVLGVASGTSLTLSGLTAGRVTFAGTAGLLSDDSKFLWDNTNKRLGVGGTAAPTYGLDLTGTASKADRTLGINGNAVVYLPDQALYFYSVAIGDGLRKLSATPVGIQGYWNLAFGFGALFECTIGAENMALGPQAMYFTTDGYSNVGVGFNALLHNTGGTHNTAIGAIYALFDNTTGYNNIAIGDQAGYNAGVALQTLHDCTFIGTGANSTTDGLVNATALGTGTQITKSNQIVLGNSSVVETYLQGLVGIQVTPTAILHLKAGTATANTAPLKFNSGTLLTAPEAGVVEFLTDSYYVTTTTNTIRRMLTAGILGRVTAQTAANASVAAYTLGAADASFIVSANVLVTTATTHNFTVTCAYTDEGNTARVLTFNLSSLAGVFATAIINTGGTVPYEGVPMHIRCKASTAITIATAAGGVYTAVAYNAEGSIRQVG